MPTTDLAADLRAQADAATHGYATKTWLSRVVGDDDERFCHPALPLSAGGQGCADATQEKNSAEAHCGLAPLDEYNAALLDAVHPVDWKDPTPEPGFVYDLIALGAGAGGLVSAKQSARRGAKSALISAHLAGGDCLNVGCVPSKALIRCARAARDRANPEFGVTGKSTIDFGEVMKRVRRLRARIAPADAHTATTQAGADVYQGFGKFTGPNTIEVNGQTLRFKKAVIATGGQAALPPIPGLRDAPYHTNNNIFNLTKQPKQMCVIGGGPIGLELAQAFACLGTKVTVLLRDKDAKGGVLPKEDPDAATAIYNSLKADGVEFAFGLKFEKVEEDRTVHCTRGGDAVIFPCDVLLVATGRKPNVAGMGLEEAGVEFDARTGVTVDDYLRTSNPDIYAVGDCCTPFQFTHVAGTMAGIAVENAVFGGSKRFSAQVIPWCTYTAPEVAHVGLYERDIAARGLESDTYSVQLKHNDRAICEGAADDGGFVKIHCTKGTDEILGATICSERATVRKKNSPSTPRHRRDVDSLVVLHRHAGESISELTVAIQQRIGLGALGKTIHPYPTVAEAIQGCGIGYNRTQWATVDTSGRKKLEKLLGAAKPYALGVLGGLALAALARR